MTDPDALRPTPLLDRVSAPSDLKGMSVPDLSKLADELRSEVIEAVSRIRALRWMPRRIGRSRRAIKQRRRSIPTRPAPGSAHRNRRIF